MIPVSAEWQTASRAQFRYQAYLIATLELAPPNARKNAVVTSSDSFSQSDVSHIMDTDMEVSKNYVTLEPNRWILDGEPEYLPRSVVTKDWWSEDTQPTVIHFKFNDTYAFPGIYAHWDTAGGTYPKKITVIGYDKDDIEVARYTIDDIEESIMLIEDEPLDGIKSADLIINEWNCPGWRTRINEFLFGLYIEFNSKNNGRIESAELSRRAKPLSDELPVNNMKITFRNLDKYFDPTIQKGVSKYLCAQQLFYIKWAFMTSYGNIETTNELPYFIEDFDIPEDSKSVNINITDRLSLLKKEYLYGTYTGASRTLYDMALEVLQRSDVINESEQQIPWDLPEFLKNYSTTAPVPDAAINVIMQYIALASCSWLWSGGETGLITFKRSKLTASEYCAIEQAQELGDPGITVNDALRSIRFKIYSYNVKESTQLGESECIINGTQVVTVKYNTSYAKEVSATITGGTLVSAEYYVSHAILTIQGSGTVKVVLQGKSIEATETLVETYRDMNVKDGKDVVVDNPLITNTDSLAEISAYVEYYYKRRLNYRGNYLGYVQMEPGDKINLETVYNQDTVEVIRNDITFNGGWTGTVELI